MDGGEIGEPRTPRRQIRGSDSPIHLDTPDRGEDAPISPVAEATRRRRLRIQSAPSGPGAVYGRLEIGKDDQSSELPQCAVCLDNLLDPVTLSCGHTGCEMCVAAWFSSVLQSARGGRLRCPAGCGAECSGFPSVSVNLRNDICGRIGEKKYKVMLKERGLDTTEARAEIARVRDAITDWRSDDSLETVGSLTAQRDWFMQQYYHTVGRLRQSEQSLRSLQEDGIVVALDFAFLGNTTIRAGGVYEKIGLCIVAIPTILCAFLLWTAFALGGIVVAIALLASTLGSFCGVCHWTLLPSGQPFALHDVSVECPDVSWSLWNAVWE
eukprot:m.80274 g.80274  ORF g.80274 m.80274 type:complete len:324 (-) comp10889_c0_seq1:192-1163(-)